MWNMSTSEPVISTLLVVTTCLTTLPHLLNLAVFTLDHQLRSGAGSLLSVYVTVVMYRNLFVVLNLLLPGSVWYSMVYCCEWASIYGQTHIIFKIHNAIISGLPTPENVHWLTRLSDDFKHVLGISVAFFGALYLLNALLSGIQHESEDAGLSLWASVAAGAGFYIDAFERFSFLPLSLYNTVMCVVVALRVRAVRRAIDSPQYQRHGGGHQQEWNMLLLKMIFMSGVQTDLLFCLFMAFFGNSQLQSGVPKHIVCFLWVLRGLEIFIIFVCKKEVWERMRSSFISYFGPCVITKRSQTYE